MLDKMNNAILVNSNTSPTADALQVKEPAPAPQPQLNAEQIAALYAVRERKNLFISGPGGTGKSFLIKYIKEHAPDGVSIGITALTGCAAILLGCGAKTLHSWGGIGLAREPADEIVQKIIKRKKNNPTAYRNWTRTDVLIIDEISMMSAELFEKINTIARLLRKEPGRPFGGMQVVAFGDFFQLPPIIRAVDGSDPSLQLAFNAPSWSSTFAGGSGCSGTIQLKQLMRQTDPVFQELLNSFRVGEIRQDHIDLLRGRMNMDWDSLEIKPTLIFPRRAEVDKINAANLDALEGGRVKYEARTVFKPEAPEGSIRMSRLPEGAALIERFDTDAPYDVAAEFAVGAQVMLIHNKDQELELVNGSRGVITRFTMGVDGKEQLPVVKFKNGMELPIGRHAWEMDTLPGVCREQIPLRLAYAVTIHKSQGATLDSALIDIGPSIWEWGQAYTAISRVRSLESLYIFAFDKRAVKAHPAVRAFYKRLDAEKKKDSE
jgi:ATP-dependent DNA helicase PIF1